MKPTQINYENKDSELNSIAGAIFEKDLSIAEVTRRWLREPDYSVIFSHEIDSPKESPTPGIWFEKDGKPVVEALYDRDTIEAAYPRAAEFARTLGKNPVRSLGSGMELQHDDLLEAEMDRLSEESGFHFSEDLMSPIANIKSGIEYLVGYMLSCDSVAEIKKVSEREFAEYYFEDDDGITAESLLVFHIERSNEKRSCAVCETGYLRLDNKRW